MALDNAQFIAELSITDPPGTDPLSEGDDQIRTSKRTQLQSFPNVNAAVTLTSAQLNDAALQSEINVFTAENTFTPQQFFSAVIRNADGTAAQPSYAFTSEFSSGMYLVAAGALGFAVAGTQRLQLGAGVMVVGSNTIQAQVGSAAAVSYGFVGEAGTGWHRPSSGVLAGAVLGVNVFNIINNEVRCFQAFRTDLGITVNTQIDANANIIFSSSLFTVWQIRQASIAGGQNLAFRRYNSGVFVDQPFVIKNATGVLNMGTLPTSSAGLVAGDLWRNPVSPGFVAVI